MCVRVFMCAQCVHCVCFSQSLDESRHLGAARKCPKTSSFRMIACTLSVTGDIVASCKVSFVDCQLTVQIRVRFPSVSLQMLLASKISPIFRHRSMLAVSSLNFRYSSRSCGYRVRVCVQRLRPRARKQFLSTCNTHRMARACMCAFMFMHVHADLADV